MLDNIRSRKDNLIYTLLILAVVAVMALYGVGKMTQDPSGDGVAATVNGEVITRREFAQEVERKMSQYQSILGAQYDEKLIAQFQIPERTLDELIKYKVLAQTAKKMDFEVPDFELAEHIRSLPFYQKNGQFDDESYAKLPNRGVEERWRRERLLIAKLQSYISDRFKMTPEELRLAYAVRETKVDVEYAKIDLNSLAPQTKPTSQEVSEFIAKTPETELKQYYDANRKDYSEKASYQLKQIRVGLPYQASDAQKKDARKKIDDIAKQVTKDNFPEIAKKFSDDEYAKKGGDVGFVTRGTLEQPLEVALGKMNPGQVSEPIETHFGYFIVQLVSKKDEKPKAFAEVKTAIGEKLFAEKRKKQYTEGKRKEWEKMLADNKPIDAELKKAKIDVKKTGPFSLGQGYIPQIGQADGILDGVFELTKEAPVAKKLYYFQDHYYYLKLANVDYAKPSELAKNEESIEKGVTSSEQSDVVNQWISDLEKKSNVEHDMKIPKGDSVASE